MMIKIKHNLNIKPLLLILLIDYHRSFVCVGICFLRNLQKIQILSTIAKYTSLRIHINKHVPLNTCRVL